MSRRPHPLTNNDIVTLRDMPHKSFRVADVWDISAPHATVRELLTDGAEGQPMWITASEVMCRVASHETVLRAAVRQSAVTARYATVA